MAQVEEPFQIFIKFDMSGKGTITIKNLLFSTTVGCLKQRIIETKGDCLGVRFRLIYGGKQLTHDNLTLKDYKLGPNATVFAALRLSGGGASVPGADTQSEVYRGQWNSNAPDYWRCSKGLDISFKYDDKIVMGQVGYTTDESTYPQGCFDVARHYENAYCPSLKCYCPSTDSIVEYWFNNCKVVFKGKLSNGKSVDNSNKPDFFGDQPCKFTGSNLDYAYLEMTVTPN
eukprot:212970_1